VIWLGGTGSKSLEINKVTGKSQVTLLLLRDPIEHALPAEEVLRVPTPPALPASSARWEPSPLSVKRHQVNLRPESLAMYREKTQMLPPPTSAEIALLRASILDQKCGLESHQPPRTVDNLLGHILLHFLLLRPDGSLCFAFSELSEDDVD
jgi:hypothetical protein